MKRMIKFFDVFVFIATTLDIVGVFYEGMELKWFDVVRIDCCRAITRWRGVYL